MFNMQLLWRSMNGGRGKVINNKVDLIDFFCFFRPGPWRRQSVGLLVRRTDAHLRAIP